MNLCEDARTSEWVLISYHSISWTLFSQFCLHVFSHSLFQILLMHSILEIFPDSTHIQLKSSHSGDWSNPIRRVRLGIASFFRGRPFSIERENSLEHWFLGIVLFLHLIFLRNIISSSRSTSSPVKQQLLRWWSRVWQEYRRRKMLFSDRGEICLNHMELEASGEILILDSSDHSQEVSSWELGMESMRNRSRSIFDDSDSLPSHPIIRIREHSRLLHDSLRISWRSSHEIE